MLMITISRECSPVIFTKGYTVGMFLLSKPRWSVGYLNMRRTIFYAGNKFSREMFALPSGCLPRLQIALFLRHLAPILRAAASPLHWLCDARVVTQSPSRFPRLCLLTPAPSRCHLASLSSCDSSRRSATDQSPHLNTAYTDVRSVGVCCGWMPRVRRADLLTSPGGWVGGR